MIMQKRKSGWWFAAVVVSAVAIVCAPGLSAQEQEKKPDNEQEKIQDDQARKNLQTFAEIERFVQDLLADKEEEPRDPFMKAKQKVEQKVEVEYTAERKPRPQAGFGKYDVEQLRLLGIYRDNETEVAMFRSQDGKLFTVKVGDAAYDGVVSVISIEGGFVKFVDELKLQGPRQEGQPEVKRVERFVRLPR